jgi:hypothetical protein
LRRHGERPAVRAGVRAGQARRGRTGMPNRTGQGFVDYVLWGDDGKPPGLVDSRSPDEVETAVAGFDMLWVETTSARLLVKGARNRGRQVSHNRRLLRPAGYRRSRRRANARVGTGS